MCSEFGKECIPLEEDANSVWAASLPQHLMENIFARLPLESLLRLGKVCEEWNVLFSSKKFLTLWSQMPKSDQWLILCGNNHCLAYSFSTSTWLRTSLSAFPVFCFKGSDQGLILLQKPSSLGWRFCVCNPITQTYFQLPPMSPIPHTTKATCIVKGDHRESYKVVVVRYDEGSAHIMQIYDSCDKLWKIAGRISDLMVPNQIAFCNSLFFFMVLEPILGSGIRVCSIQDCTAISFVPVSFEWSMPKLAVCGQLVLIVVPILKANVIRDIIVWQLESHENFKDPFWKEITRMPQLILENFDRDWKWDKSDCIGLEDWLCFRMWGGTNVVEYNLSQRSWKFLSNSPTTDRDEIMCSFAFEPNPLIMLCSEIDTHKISPSYFSLSLNLLEIKPQRGSLSAIIVCAVVVIDGSTSGESIDRELLHSYWSERFHMDGGEWVVTIVITDQKRINRYIDHPDLKEITISMNRRGIMKKGIVATVKKDEEWKILHVLQTIADKLHGK